MPSFLSRVLSFVLRLVLWTIAAIFAVSLMLAGLVLLALGLLRSLLTGQKPKPVVFGRFQRFSSQAVWPGAARPGAARPGAAAAREADVVDVEVREIRGDKRLP